MTALEIDHPEYFGDICEVIRLFTQEKRIESVRSNDGVLITAKLEMHKTAIFEAKLFEDGILQKSMVYECEAFGLDQLEYKKHTKRGFKICVYRLLCGFYAKKLPWGCLTGIRPTKLLRELEATMGSSEARQLLTCDFDVSEEKFSLTKQILKVQDRCTRDIAQDDIDIYVGIPYCTSRCSYCSFSSGVTKCDEDTYAYTQMLLKQINDLKCVIEGRNIRAIYVGGGTPTALSAKQLKSVLEALPKVECEFCVEAGRPDTITREKLDIIAGCGANRISVNAQTLNDNTLKIIGREHTAQDFFDAYELAREYPFVINADVIIGLPGEGENEFLRTLDGMIDIDPNNITVHTLAVKKGSKFAEDNEFVDTSDAARLVEVAREKLQNSGYNPYYMYRQKYMAGNLENVGYSKPGCECVYNIDMMEEIASVLAMGAGGISKKVYDKKIKRGPCVKDIKNYIERTDEMTQRMIELFS